MHNHTAVPPYFIGKPPSRQQYLDSQFVIGACFDAFAENGKIMVDTEITDFLTSLYGRGVVVAIRRCRVCGCDHRQACPGGCAWVDIDLCSTCAEERPDPAPSPEREQYRRGIIDGIRRFAWWKDGVQYVGSCGTPLKRAIADLERELP